MSAEQIREHIVALRDRAKRSAMMQTRDVLEMTLPVLEILDAVPPVTVKEEPFYEEGDMCPVPGCGGHMEFGEVENCTCFQSAPCSRCTNNPMVCAICGEDPYDFHSKEAL